MFTCFGIAGYFTTMKRAQQLQYKRKWTAATRSLKKQLRETFVESDRDSEDSEQALLGSADSSVLNLLEDGIENNSEREPAPDIDLQGNASSFSDTDSVIDSDNMHADDQHDGWECIDCDVTVSSHSEDDNDCFESDLAAWVTEFQIKQNAVDAILKLLKRSGHPDLPCTCRTLLHTARQVETQVKSGLDYHYLGLGSQLLKHFKQYSLPRREQAGGIEIPLNVDGLPLFHSSSSMMWPVLCAIVNMQPVTVFPVVLTCGDTKPTDLDFLSDTVHDLKNILQHGLQDGDNTIHVALRCIVCGCTSKGYGESKQIIFWILRMR